MKIVNCGFCNLHFSFCILQFISSPCSLYSKLVKACFLDTLLGCCREAAGLAQFEGGGHDVMAAFGDSVIKRSGNFSD